MVYFTRHTGDAGEQAVADWLVKDGFVVLARNYRVRQGEVDLIASKGELLVFVEVKTRLAEHFYLSEVITRSKQRKIIYAARQYLASKFQYLDKVCRFDVALVTGNDFQITYIPHAFSKDLYD